ncbi:MAG TPA: hypothetical protein PKA76_15330 [Pirellulaceae bacterium]|nr:hypothetical protein [Pyrinomonadaceae bacterium]HMP65578.1 hypothetical protein [Pyrinomonadaceae bacterium]HMP70717.1 hypothetical protein [Pirellulaceae bacterium]
MTEKGSVEGFGDRFMLGELAAVVACENADDESLELVADGLADKFAFPRVDLLNSEHFGFAFCR